MTERPEGWGAMLGVHKWHYFRDGRSLCGRWLRRDDSGLEQGNDHSPDNCRECVKRLTHKRKVQS